ncbi:MAG: AIR synthase related protein [Balneolaceae bacterium]|nr:AIR synthase related protein [Balneolaceae bacterium]
MTNMDNILENVAIGRWSAQFKRSDRQVNKLHETDSELLEIPGLVDDYLAVTIDTVAEEITTGLYREPFTMGWVTIMACLSDLAAVGAWPLGVVISVSCEPGRDQAFITEIARGMEEACQTAGTSILGGDTNTTDAMSLTACSFGLVPRIKMITRCGCRLGDEVCHGKSGQWKCPWPGTPFGGSQRTVSRIRLPHAGPQAGELIRKYGTACMSTSDGLLSTLDQLMRLNNNGFRIEFNPGGILEPAVMKVCQETGTSPWMMLAGLHGEFVLVGTARPDAAGDLRAHGNAAGIEMIRIGKVVERPDITLVSSEEKETVIDMVGIRNLLQDVGGNLERYLAEFWKIGEDTGLNSM